MVNKLNARYTYTVSYGKHFIFAVYTRSPLDFFICFSEPAKTLLRLKVKKFEESVVGRGDLGFTHLALVESHIITIYSKS